MTQSSYILGTILAGFVIFITTRGELPRYMGFLVGTPNQATTKTDVTAQFSNTNASNNPSPSNAGGTLSFDTIVKGAEIAAAFV
jgi:hypothetical protein